MDYYLFQTLIIYIFLSFVFLVGILPIPARIAKNKGYSYIVFFIFAFFLYPIALICALLIDEKNDFKSDSEKAEILLKYKKLLDEGIISKDEFEEKKRRTFMI